VAERQTVGWIAHKSTLGGGGTQEWCCLRTGVSTAAQQHWEGFARERVARCAAAIRRREDREASRQPWRA
jgi:hypothetical protein